MGVLHSFLCVFDGVSADMPAFEIIAAPHPSDKAFHEKNGENWWPPLPEEISERDDFITIHGGHMLHDLLYKK
jgi:hypothetical protein